MKNIFSLLIVVLFASFFTIDEVKAQASTLSQTVEVKGKNPTVTLRNLPDGSQEASINCEIDNDQICYTITKTTETKSEGGGSIIIGSLLTPVHGLLINQKELLHEVHSQDVNGVYHQSIWKD